MRSLFIELFYGHGILFIRRLVRRTSGIHTCALLEFDSGKRKSSAWCRTSRRVSRRWRAKKAQEANERASESANERMNERSAATTLHTLSRPRAAWNRGRLGTGRGFVDT